MSKNVCNACFMKMLAIYIGRVIELVIRTDYSRLYMACGDHCVVLHCANNPEKKIDLPHAYWNSARGGGMLVTSPNPTLYLWGYIVRIVFIKRSKASPK